MAARQSVARPLRLIAQTARDGAKTSATRRAFATGAARAKESDMTTASKDSLPVSDTSELPNLRHAQRGPQGKLHVPIVNPAGMRRYETSTAHCNCMARRRKCQG